MNDNSTITPIFDKASFEGQIITVNQNKDIIDACQKLLESSDGILGFDTETKPAFRKGESYKVSLLQLSSETVTILFRLHYINEFGPIKDILENKKFVKTGVAIRDDIKGLQKLFPFNAENFVELADIAKQRGLKNFGLKGMTEEILGLTLSKKAKLSNWQAKDLTSEQNLYAATDSWIGRQLYLELVKES